MKRDWFFIFIYRRIKNNVYNLGIVRADICGKFHCIFTVLCSLCPVRETDAGDYLEIWAPEIVPDVSFIFRAYIG